MTFSEETMSPGGRFCEDVAESHITLADSDAATSFSDLRTSPFRKALPGLNGNAGMPSNKNVHDLLECPVCMNLMCPPIHQVLLINGKSYTVGDNFLFMNIDLRLIGFELSGSLTNVHDLIQRYTFSFTHSISRKSLLSV